jgi:channel protein (hemolysin III family)
MGERPTCDRGDDEQNDQYTVRGGNYFWAVLCKNDTGRLHPRSLLGDFGHVERLSAWVHLVAGVAFGLYAAVRPIAISIEHTISESLTTASAASVCFCFLSSAVYHCTSPSKTLAMWTRQLDFIGIYTALAVGALADCAIATRGFQSVTLLAAGDIPIACTIVASFFIVRRVYTASSDTWMSYLGGCTVSFGLFRRTHVDRVHTGVRQSTSFVLAIAYFTTLPSVFHSFGSANGLTLVGIELAALLLLVVGMVVDNAGAWPDVSLSSGKGPSFLVCKGCGCVGSAHSLWHILSVVATVKSAVGREVALTWHQ